MKIIDTETKDVLNELAADLEGKPFNAELLAQVADYIEQHPAEFDMYEWSNIDARSLWEKFTMVEPYTVGCVACHAVRMGDGDMSATIPAEAQRVLGVSDSESHALFYEQNWPEPYRGEFESASGDSEGQAWIAAQRLRYFVKTRR